MPQPDFMIVGVARCGTTSLYHYLKQHPDISFPDKKEPKYYSSRSLPFPHKGPGDDTVDRVVVKEAKDYEALFSGLKAQRIGEASSDYLFYHELTAHAIREEMGDIPIIVSIRNPMERAHSAYSNLIRDGRETEEFPKALELEEQRLADNYDWMWAYKKGGMYADGIASYQKHFSNVHVVLFDDLATQPQRELDIIFQFLGVAPFDAVDTSTKYSHSGKPKNKLAALLANRNNKVVFALRQTALRLIPRKFLEKVAANMFAKDEVDDALENQLREYFRADIQRTSRLINKDLNHWLK